MKLVVIIPAHNEEKSLPASLNSLSLCKEEFDTVVIADNCTDKTAQIARKMNIRVIERTDKTRIGKPYALRYAIEILLKEPYTHFVFLDADSTVQPNFITAFKEVFGQGAVAAQVRYALQNNDPPGMFDNIIRIGFDAFNTLRPLARDYWNLSVGIFGNGFGLARQLLEQLPFGTSLIEDAQYHLGLIERGYKVVFISSTIVYASIPSSIQGNVTQRSRWEGGRLKLLMAVGPQLLQKILQGNLRLIEPLLDLLLPPLSYYVMMLILLLLLPFTLTKIYATAALIILGLHVLLASVIAGCKPSDYFKLLLLPFYLLWKLILIFNIKKIFKEGFQWKRTERH